MKPTSDWRSLIKVHPAAEMLPLMAPEELRVLGEDIKAHGLLHPIQMLSGAVIDGRNRLDAMALAGLTMEFRKRDNRFESQIWVDGKVIGRCHHNTPIDIPDPARFVIEQNILRRHLTTAQKSELIAKLLKADPTKSDRAVAKLAHVDNKTVAAKREQLEAGEEIPQLKKRVGADGRSRAVPKTVPTETPDAKKSASADRPEVNGVEEPALRKAYNKANEITIAQGLNARWELDKAPSLGWAQAVVKALTPTDFQSFKEWFQEYLTEAVATATEIRAQADAAE